MQTLLEELRFCSSGGEEIHILAVKEYVMSTVLDPRLKGKYIL